MPNWVIFILGLGLGIGLACLGACIAINQTYMKVKDKEDRRKINENEKKSRD